MTALRRMRHRRTPSGEDGLALLLSLGMIAVLSGLLLTMLALVVAQVRPTAQARKDIGSLNAAASGLQVGLAVLRSAVDANGEGARGQLPCTAGAVTTFRTATATSSTPGAVLTGAPSAVPGAFRYTVSIAYFSTDPTDQPPQWLRDNALACPLTTTPLFAYLQSYGTGLAPAGTPGHRGDRAQTGLYRFAVPGANVAGGRLRSYGTDMCVDAGTSPSVGSALSLEDCQTPTPTGQLWQYRADLTLFYGGNPALNLCIEGSAQQSATLQRCTGTGDGDTYVAGATPHYAPGQQPQLWSFDDNGHFAAANDDGAVGTICLQAASPGPGQALSVYGCAGYLDDYHSFDPDPEVGAGKAGGNTTGLPGSPTNQLVNFEEFGRCLDVTSQQVSSTFLIAYPCKQAPDSTTLTWNQVWRAITITGQQVRLSTDSPWGAYCLTALSTTQLANVTPCDATRPEQQWTARGDVPGSPETSYTLVSGDGRCLSLGGTRTDYGASQIVAETCNGSDRQRWNAPPSLPPAGLSNVQEGSVEH